MSYWDDRIGASLKPPSNPVLKSKRSQSKQAVRHSNEIDDGSESDDPLLLTEGSSLPGSPKKMSKSGRLHKRADDASASDDDRARPANSNTARERKVLKAQNGARTKPKDPAASEPQQKDAAKKSKRVANPLSQAFTSRARPAAPSASTAAKSKQPATAKNAAPSRSRSGAYDGEDEGGDADATPKAPRKANPFTKQQKKTVSDASSSAPALLPFQDELDRARSAETTREPQPYPLAGVKRSTTAAQPAELAPFPLLHMIRSKSSEPQPAPYPLADKLSRAAAQDPHTPVTAKPKAVKKHKTLVDKVLEDAGLGTPSPIREELLAPGVAPFPMDLPAISSSSIASRAKSSSSDEGVRPFPMKLPSKSSASTSKISPKRPADEQTDSDRALKRRKRDAPVSPPRPPRPAKPASPQSPKIDPSKLCPYCDEVLPESRSDEFEELLRNARAKSWSKPRRKNPLGLKAPMVVFVSVCERHRFEARVLPKAKREGWPSKIDFNAIPARIMKKRHILDDILKDPTTSSFYREAMENVARVGARVAESAMGQYAIFERIQPGYYGERGAVVLHQTMFSLYKPEDLQEAHDRFAPLSTQTFQHSVLVPEAALALIMEDRNETRAQALKTMRASCRYGNLMFPDDDDEEGAGEAIMRERARQRRIEIEQEEAEEREQERAAAAAEAAKKAAKTTTKKARGKATDAESQTDASTTTTRKRAAKAKPSSVADAGSESCGSSATRRSTKTKRSPVDDESGTDASTTSTRPARAVKRATSYVEVSDSDDEPVVVTAPKAKKRPVKQAAPPAADSDDEPIVISTHRAPKRGASQIDMSAPVARVTKRAATTSSRSSRSTATDSEAALSDLSQHSKARRARKRSPVIDLTSDVDDAHIPTSSSLPQSRGTDLGDFSAPFTAAGSKTSTSKAGKYDFMASSDEEDEDIPDVVMKGLQHDSPPFTQRMSAVLSSPPRKKAPSRSSSMRPAAPQTRPHAFASDDDTQATPVARRQHTRWDQHGMALAASEEVTPRPPLPRTGSFSSHHSNSSTNKFKRGSNDSWLLSTSSPSQRQTSARNSPSKCSVNEEDMADFMNASEMELSD